MNTNKDKLIVLQLSFTNNLNNLLYKTDKAIPLNHEASNLYMLMNNHGRCLKRDVKYRQKVSQTNCESGNFDLLWGKRKIYGSPLGKKIPTVICDRREFCISSNSTIYDIYFGKRNGEKEQDWSIIGGGNQLSQGNNCLAIQGDADAVGSKAVMEPCDPKQKGQIWSFVTEK